MGLKHYDPKKIIITFGAIPISGFADGSFLSVEANEDTFTLQVGSDGDGTRSRTNNNSGRATIQLMQSSDSNDLLSAQHELDKALPNGAGCQPLLIQDLQGRTLVAAEKAWVVKPPAAGFGREAEAREWVIESADMRIFNGGN